MFRNFLKGKSEAELKTLASLCVGVAVMFGVALYIGGGGERTAFEDPTLQTAAFSWAVSHVSEIRGYGGSKGMSAAQNASNKDESGSSNSHYPAPLACDINGGDGGPWTACIQESSSDISKFRIYGVFDVYEVGNENNGTAVYFRAGYPNFDGNNGRAWRLFWQKPTVYRGINDTVVSEGAAAAIFNNRYWRDTEGHQARDLVNSKGTFENRPYYNLKDGDSPVEVRPAASEPFLNLVVDGPYKSHGGTININEGSSVKLQWACQPYQIQYFEEYCNGDFGGSGECTAARALNLFDRITTEGVPGNPTARAGSLTHTPSDTSTYEVTCVANSEGDSWEQTEGYVTVPYRYEIPRRDGPAMKVTVKVANRPTAKIRAKKAGEPWGAWGQNVTVTAGDTVYLNAEFTFDNDDDTKLATRFRRSGGYNYAGTGNNIYLNDNYTVSGSPNGTGFTTNTVGTYTFTPQIQTSAWGWYSGTPIEVTVVPKQTISISANPASVTSGNSSTISWSCGNSTSGSVTYGSGTAFGSGTSGSKSTGALTASRTYTLTCTNAVGNTVTDSVTVTVINAPAASISASPNPVTSGQSSTLTWNCTNSTSGSVTYGSGTVFSNNMSGTGVPTGALNANRTYTLTCTNSAGTTATQHITVVVAGAPLASLVTTPSLINYGSSSIVEWSCANSTSGSVTYGSGTAFGSGVSGSQSSGALTSNRTYTLTCTNSAGTTDQDIKTVTVCSSSTHVEGGSCISNGPRSCNPANAPAGSGQQTWSGGSWGTCYPQDPPGCNSGYHIDGTSGLCVQDNPQLSSFIANPARVEQGGYTTLSWQGTELPATCSLASSPSISGLNTTPASGPTGGSLSNVGPIIQETLFTLSCGSDSAQKTVTVIPNVEEI